MSKSNIKQLIADGKTRQTVETLVTCTTADSDLHTEALALSARYQNYLREKNGGRAEPKWLDTELNQINVAALYLVERLPNGKIQGVSNWKKWAAIAATIVAFLGAIAEFSGWSLRDLFKSQASEPLKTEQVPPANITTSGANSPAISAPGGEVHINYGEPASTKTPAKADSLPKK